MARSTLALLRCRLLEHRSARLPREKLGVAVESLFEEVLIIFRERTRPPLVEGAHPGIGTQECLQLAEMGTLSARRERAQPVYEAHEARVVGRKPPIQHRA